MNNFFYHLTLDDRREILRGIERNATKASIARNLGKDRSTIGKEILSHRTCTRKSKLPRECSNYRHCKFNRGCTAECPDFVQFKCNRRDRSPGACNGCSNRSKCRFDKMDYNPEKAHSAYKENLSDSRAGVNMTYTEAKEMADVIGPLLKQGQSPYRIINSHPELGICEKTLYNYIEWDVFHEISGITVMDLRRQVGRKLSKKKSKGYKKRKDRKYLEGRLYEHYQNYMKENPTAMVTQMDTVYNNETNGPFVQTFKFVSTGIILGMLHEEKTAAEMISGVNLLEEILGPELFRKHVEVLLTDRGTEFSGAEAIENDSDELRRTRVFYCDPMQSGQKGTLENKHIELRYILPKKTDLRSIGLVNQEALNLALSHINSAACESLGGKSPMDLTEFLYPELFERLKKFGLRKIPADEIILKPILLKPFRNND